MEATKVFDCCWFNRTDPKSLFPIFKERSQQYITFFFSQQYITISVCYCSRIPQLLQLIKAEATWIYRKLCKTRSHIQHDYIILTKREQSYAICLDVLPHWQVIHFFFFLNLACKLFILYKTFHFSDNLQRRFHYLILFFKSQFSLAIIRIVVMIYGCAEQSGFVAGDHSDWHIWWTHLTSSTVFFFVLFRVYLREKEQHRLIFMYWDFI